MNNVDYILTRYYFKSTIKDTEKYDIISQMIQKDYQVKKITKRYITFIKFI